MRKATRSLRLGSSLYPSARGPSSRWNGAGCGALKCRASRVFLVRAVAYGLQAEVYGGLDTHTLRLLKKAGQTSGKASRTPPRRLSKGSKLFREWHGDVHEVLVLDKGFFWRGETYPSLSAIARVITGTNWNGWAFFGLKRRAKKASPHA
jgi:hypothetical protein